MFRKRKQIKQAVEILRNGGTVVFPTETSYGLAVDATNLEAVERLMKIKGRDTKTLPVIVSDLKMAKKFVELSGQALQLAKKYWPGPLTIVLPIRDNALTGVSPHCVRDDQVAVRISSHPTACRLSQKLGHPIVATSANRAGQSDCYSVEQIKKQYQEHEQPDYIIDVGELSKTAPSTVVRVVNDQVEVLRQGEIQL